jgi:hypothetical protein
MRKPPIDVIATNQPHPCHHMLLDPTGSTPRLPRSHLACQATPAPARPSLDPEWHDEAADHRKASHATKYQSDSSGSIVYMCIVPPTNTLCVKLKRLIIMGISKQNRAASLPCVCYNMPTRCSASTSTNILLSPSNFHQHFDLVVLVVD